MKIPQYIDQIEVAYVHGSVIIFFDGMLCCVETYTPGIFFLKEWEQ